MAHADLLAAALLNEPKGAPKLPPLHDVRSHQLYRARDAEELEEATWHVEGPDGQPPALADPIPVRLCSRTSETDAIINFHNNSGVAVRALWIDFRGNEVAYSVLEPNTTKRYRTYATHPWIVREVTTGMRMMLGQCQVVEGAAQETTVEITLPPRIHWEANTHTCFSEAFKASTRALLVAHKRLENAAAAAMHSAAHINSSHSQSFAKQSAFERAMAAEPYGVIDCAVDTDDVAVDAHMLEQQQGRQGSMTGMAETAGAAGAAAAGGMRLKRVLSDSELASVAPLSKVMSPVKAAAPAVAWTQGHPASAGAQQRHVTVHVDARSPVHGRAGVKGVASSGSGTGVAAGGVKSPKKSPKKSTVLRSLMGAIRHGLVPTADSSLTSSPTGSPFNSPFNTAKTLNRATQSSGLSNSGLAYLAGMKQQGAPQPGGLVTNHAIVSPSKRVLLMGGDVAAVRDQQEALPAGCHLGMLPHHLVVHIIELLAQQEVVLQHINREAPIGRAAILPALLSGPPPEAEPAAAPAAAAAAAAGAAGADANAAGADGAAGGGADVHAAGVNGEGQHLGVPVAAALALPGGADAGAMLQGQQGQQQEEEQQEQQEGGVGPADGPGLVGLQEPVLPAAAMHFLQHAWDDAINGEGNAAAGFAFAGGDGVWGDGGWGDDGGEADGQLPPGWAPLEQGAVVAGGVDFAEVLMGMLVLEGQAPDAQDE